MKTVIFCGGKGTRLKDYTDMPKPLVDVGDKPVLIHLMGIYSNYGFNDFILCLGYKGDMIKQYFIERKWRENNFEIRENKLKFYKKTSTKWKVALIDTGKDATKAERLMKVHDLIKRDKDKNFFVAYGDDISNVNIRKLLEFHKKNRKIATLTAVRPINQYGVIELDEDNLNEIKAFKEKPKMDKWVNGGFYVFNKNIFRYIDKGDELEKEVVKKLINNRQLVAYKHDDFWKSMNTFKDVQELNDMWEKRNIPWKRPRRRV